MSNMAVASIVLLVLGLGVVLLNPLYALGNSYGPGWGDVLNGGAGLVLLLLAGIVGITAVLRNRRRA
jgi:hypothetical protein